MKVSLGGTKSARAYPESIMVGKGIRAPQREIEALVGGALLKAAKASQKRTLTKCKLVLKQVHLPGTGYTMHYHERAAVAPPGGAGGDVDDNAPTLLFFHGITQKSEDYAPFIASLDVPPNVRILCPEQAGHGRDVERARTDPDGYEQPTHESILETTSEFLDVVRAGSNVHAFGISLGGAVCYYVANKRPDVIKKAVLVSPALIPCVDQKLTAGIVDGTNPFVCFESRDDVKSLMRDLSTGKAESDDRKKKDPVPKFLFEAIYRNSKTVAPEGHNRAMLLSLLTNIGVTESGALRDGSGDDAFSAVTDVDGSGRRLVIWPEKDQIINCEQGKRFFGISRTDDGFASKSPNTEFETIPDCGHVFHADGRVIFDIIRPRTREYLLAFDDPSLPTQ
ncbi:hypothetical protein ACHAWF_011463 [Thalassiosira exigua]